MKLSDSPLPTGGEGQGEGGIINVFVNQKLVPKAIKDLH